ncbi:MAG: hypothetical protein R3B93_16205 [Bacteroidia bacterium]
MKEVIPHREDVLLEEIDAKFLVWRKISGVKPAQVIRWDGKKLLYLIFRSHIQRILL